MLTTNPGIEFTIIEALKDLYLRRLGRPTGSLATFAISAASKIGATLATYPYILAKVRMENSGAPSALLLLSEVYSAEGLLGFYKGVQIQLIKAVLFTSFRNTIKQWVEAIV